MKYATF
jgi:hypothetical protein